MRPLNALLSFTLVLDLLEEITPEAEFFLLFAFRGGADDSGGRVQVLPGLDVVRVVVELVLGRAAHGGGEPQQVRLGHITHGPRA